MMSLALVSGGPAVETALPDNVQEVRLPGLMMDNHFKQLFTTSKEKSVDQIKSDRQKMLFDLFEKASPDIFIVELYPFGRKAFRFELDPILKGIRTRKLPKCQVICSLRDILVEKKDVVKYEKRVVDSLNSYFDAVLVHADPGLVKLDETFTSTTDITIPINYTGFVAPKPAPNSRSRLRKKLGIGKEEVLVVASAGGGNVGAPLLEAVMNAVEYMDTEKRIYLYVFTGPFMDKSDFEALKKLAGTKKQIARFSIDFLSYLVAADLSVSMAGYNTCMNIIAAQVPSLVWPFSQNREQRLRAERLSLLNVMKVLDDKDLRPDSLAIFMDETLAGNTRPKVSINLNGAANTAQWIETWIEASGRLQ
jgi:predicted glycosyltransferase